jgi:hypothetical protein
LCLVIASTNQTHNKLDLLTKYYFATILRFCRIYEIKVCLHED